MPKDEYSIAFDMNNDYNIELVDIATLQKMYLNLCKI